MACTALLDDGRRDTARHGVTDVRVQVLPCDALLHHLRGLISTSRGCSCFHRLSGRQDRIHHLVDYPFFFYVSLQNVSLHPNPWHSLFL